MDYITFTDHGLCKDIDNTCYYVIIFAFIVKFNTISGSEYQDYIGTDSARKKDLHDLKLTDKIINIGKEICHFSGIIGQCKQ
jgi:hypothetical protein